MGTGLVQESGGRRAFPHIQTRGMPVVAGTDQAEALESQWMLGQMARVHRGVPPRREEFEELAVATPSRRLRLGTFRRTPGPGGRFWLVVFSERIPGGERVSEGGNRPDPRPLRSRRLRGQLPGRLPAVDHGSKI